MAHEVFISYSANDKPVADAVCARLEQDSFRCWYAPRDVAPGADRGAAILEAVEQSKVMVLIFTDFANESGEVLREINNAVRCGVVIVPFRLTKASPSGSMRYYLSTVHWLDALDGELEENIRRLSELVRTVLTGNPSARPTAARKSVPVDAPDLPKPEAARLVRHSPLIHLVLKALCFPLLLWAAAVDNDKLGAVPVLLLASGSVLDMIPALPLRGRSVLKKRLAATVFALVCAAALLILIFFADTESRVTLIVFVLILALWSAAVFLCSRQDSGWVGKAGGMLFRINNAINLVLVLLSISICVFTAVM